MPNPSVSRIVHYVSYGTPGGEFTSQCRAAIINEVAVEFDGKFDVGLTVVNPTGLYFNQHVEQDEENHAGGTWHWPERVE
jgi:hypothetical protein